VPSSLSSTDRRERIRQYKDAFPSMGVFALRNLANGRVYVGASTNVEGAINRMRFELQRRGHRNAPLMADWLAFGPDQFRFEVLDRVRPSTDPAFDARAELDAMAELWREELDCFMPAGYNARRGSAA
jgi:hypothetical protein